MEKLQKFYRSIYKENFCICNKAEKIVKYSCCKQNGKGIIINYDVMPGVILSIIRFDDIKELYSEKINYNILEINYCLKGRFECEFKNNEFVYVGEGDLAVDFVDHKNVISDFPLKLYYGIAFYVDIDILKVKCKNYMEFFGIDIDKKYGRKY